MKNLLKKVLSVAAATALLMTSVVSASAEAHNHGDGTAIPDLQHDGDYTITLTTDKEFDENSKFGAYQIFTGVVPEETDTDNYVVPEPNPGDDHQKLPITNIKWGNAFGSVGSADAYRKIVGFVIALATMPSDDDYGFAFNNFDGFEDFVYEDGGTYYLATRFGGTNINASTSDFTDVDFDQLAVEVAQVLAKHQTTEWLQQFADILGGFSAKRLGDDTVYHMPSYLAQYYTHNSTETPDGTEYKIEDIPAGYYMIKDLSTINDDDTDKAFSARMLFVVNNITQQVKSDVPTLAKNIVRDGEDSFITDAAGVGEVINFKLTGTLPSNFDSFVGGYQYTFTDQLPNGLDLSTSNGTVYQSGTFDGYITVKVKGLMKWNEIEKKWNWNENAEATIPVKYDSTIGGDTVTHAHHLYDTIPSTAPEYPASVNNYDVSYDHNKITIKFVCLKEVRLRVEGDASGIYCLGYEDADNSSVIYVEYSAKVNEKAVVNTGNKNKATIEYSDNPQAYGDTDTTTPEEATVFTFGLNILKVDSAEFVKEAVDNGALSGAGFALIREALSGGYEIASFVNGVIGDDYFDGDDYKSINTWETLTVTDGNLDAALKAFFTSGHSQDNYIITSSADGLINISGLDNDIKYTMVEYVVPEGYAKIDPFTVTLTAETESSSISGETEYTGDIASADVSNTTVAGKLDYADDKYVIKTETDGTDEDGIEPLTVANFKYENLPSTGGIGVYIYYIAGGCVVALALVLFALSKKKKTTK